ncbi:hypothetical protein [Phage f2b1]|nr:hypothetical protein [Phage f2b1]
MNVGEKIVMALMIFGILLVGGAAVAGILLGAGWFFIAIVGLTAKIAYILAILVLLFVLILVLVFVEG